MHKAMTDLQERILRYLQFHEHAAETADGVNCVWLGRPYAAGDVRAVEKALDALVDAGELERHRLPGGSAAYRRARRES